MARVSFHSDYPGFQIPNRTLVRAWLISSIKAEGRQVGELQYVFCTDEYLLTLNQQFLQHDYFTDIITFDYSGDHKGRISGDLFISIDRVRENAFKSQVDFNREILRNMIHGLLHIIGYQDKTKKEIKNIRKKEDHYLDLYFVK